MKTNQNKIRMALFTLITAAVSCNNAQHMPMADIHSSSPLGQQGGVVTTGGPYYLTEVLPLLNNETTGCLPCHGSGTPMDWTNYDIFKSKRLQILQRVLGPNANMPMGRTLAAKDKETLQKWLDSGMPYAAGNTPAPETVSAPNPAPAPQPSPQPAPEEPTPTPIPGPTPPPSKIPKALTYDEDALPVFKQYCSLCHNQSSGGKMRNWLKYEIAVQFKDSVKAKMIDKSMPLPGANIKMPDSARQILISWVDQGAIQAPISFNTNILPIIQKNCIACHNSTSAPPLYNWTSYDIAVSKKANIYDRVIVKKDMPAGGVLSEEDYTLMKLWLETGSNP